MRPDFDIAFVLQDRRNVFGAECWLLTSNHKDRVSIWRLFEDEWVKAEVR
jgi:hypothetical protein